MAAESGKKAVKPVAIPEGEVSWVLVQLEPDASPEDVGNVIREKVPGTRVISPGSLSRTVTANLAGIISLLYYAAIVVTLITVPALLIVSVLLAREMNEEITLLGALGATRSFVLRLILAGSFASSVIGTVAGIAAAIGVLVLFQNLIAFTLEIPFSIPSPTALLIAAGSASFLTIMLGGLVSIYPTLKIVRSEPYRAIRS